MWGMIWGVVTTAPVFLSPFLLPLPATRERGRAKEGDDEKAKRAGTG
jgi:hypothetical protein